MVITIFLMFLLLVQAFAHLYAFDTVGVIGAVCVVDVVGAFVVTVDNDVRVVGVVVDSGGIGSVVGGVFFIDGANCWSWNLCFIDHS